jgi:hypothetical protein
VGEETGGVVVETLEAAGQALGGGLHRYHRVGRVDEVPIPRPACAHTRTHENTLVTHMAHTRVAGRHVASRRTPRGGAVRASSFLSHLFVVGGGAE